MKALRLWMALLLSLSCIAAAETDTVLILNTNDMHDHIRPGYDGIGGVAYISAYVQGIRAERPDTLLLDGGDVMEKGDLLAFRTKSGVMYEAMGRIGYDAAAVGNHDLAYGIPHLKACEEAAQGLSILCLNMRDEDGATYFPGSKIFDVDGVKVGVIGLTTKKYDHTLDTEASAALVSEEAARLEPDVHLIVVLCHLGTLKCRKIASLAPAVDVFVGGHTHEGISDLRRTKDTGAILVQAGQYARNVGRLELTIDLDTEEIVEAKNELVEMRHDTIPCDRNMLTWVREREQATCPEAAQNLTRSAERVGRDDMGLLAAAAFKKSAGADIGFCHAGKIIRSELPAGDIDVNALFLTGGQRGNDIVIAPLTGAQIEAYFLELLGSSAGPTQWVGFHAKMRRARDVARRAVYTDLDAERLYRVVMPEREWTTAVLQQLEDYVKGHPDRQQALAASEQGLERCTFTFTDALSAYVEMLDMQATTLKAQVAELASEKRLTTILW